MGQIYNNPIDGSASTIGSQIRTDYYQKKALIDVVKEQYFTPLADTTTMPKNFGKKIKCYHYLPMLDERNVNDQGIDAAGVIMTTTQRFVQFPSLVVAVANASKTTATAAINANINNNGSAETVATAGADNSGGTGYANITLTKNNIKYATSTTAGTVTTAIKGSVASIAYGNIYGSSKDVGTILSKLPTITETGGRKNRVGFTRLTLESNLRKFGFFEEYTQESLDFDTDEELEMHINREMLRGANEITEDMLQIDLLSAAASSVRYAGLATTDAEITGESGATEKSEVTYDDLVRLSIMLDNNRTPKKTTYIAGSRMVDTKVIGAGRLMFIGSELQPTMEQMLDYNSKPVFIPIQHYADAGNVYNGEIGTIGPFRIIVVPEMLHWAGVGATVSTNGGYRATNGRYDVFPMLVIGDQAFTTIGFQTDGKSSKFKIYHKKPGETAVTTDDPYGEMGLMSIKWYGGFMALREERIALIKTVAKN